jgi:surface carbohydrate biosynthesis protein (TIGR04326 family)
MMPKIIIWDSQEPCPESEHTTILWSQYNLKNSIEQISMPEYIEKNANLLKTRYLAWIYELGLAKVSNSTVIKKLKIRENLSYWWMTPLAEKFNYSKSPQITDAIRMLAFDEWFQSVQVESIVLISKNNLLVDCLERYCKRANLKFKWQSSPDKVNTISKAKLIKRMLPNRIKILIWLTKFVFKKLHFYISSRNAWYKSEAEITFFSYFTNFTQKAHLEGKFESNYWANLPETLIAAGKKTNWLHIFVEDSSGLNNRAANKLIKQFNLKSNGDQNHVLLDSFLNIKILIKSFVQWSNLQSKLSETEKALSGVLSGQVNLWPFFEDEYKKKTKGISLLENILQLNLFESALSHLPKQNYGVYIFEQQPWELALISTWKAHSHNDLIGMQHSSVLFWDLRYFQDPRTYRSMKNLGFPMPDKIAVNGSTAKQTLVDSGYPISELESSEALRYMYLEKQVKRHIYSTSKENLKILVLGDYEIEKTLFQIDLLEKSLEILTFTPKIILKPHPACQIQKYDNKIMEITKNTLSELLFEVDVVFTSAATTGAIDAYCVGLPVISILDPLTLNLSPLRGVPGVQYVNTPQQLAAAIKFLCENHQSPTDSANYFTLDSNLPRWRTLLQL